ncbi:6-phosphofructokinase [soil metagenome]
MLSGCWKAPAPISPVSRSDREVGGADRIPSPRIQTAAIRATGCLRMIGRTLMVGQSGGATAVINATLAGVIAAGRASGVFNRILGLKHGTQGFFDEQFVDLTDLGDSALDALRKTPSAALGTSRQKLDDDRIVVALDVMDRHHCDAFVLIGGNDSADSALRFHEQAGSTGRELSVVLAPKTVDNDLVETDHCPGYASAAKAFANIVRDATYDSIAAPWLYPVKFIDVMGRDAGWLAASGDLGFGDGEADLRPLLVLPERPPASGESLVEEIGVAVRDRGWVVCVLPETLRDASGSHLSGDFPDSVDPFGHPYQMPPAVTMTAMTRSMLGINARFERPGSSIRMSMSMASPVDLREAYDAGRAAAGAVASGESGRMISLQRRQAPDYEMSYGQCLLDLVANQVRLLDERFIATNGRATTGAFREYALPLLGKNPFPPYFRM